MTALIVFCVGVSMLGLRRGSILNWVLAVALVNALGGGLPDTLARATQAALGVCGAIAVMNGCLRRRRVDLPPPHAVAPLLYLSLMFAFSALPSGNASAVSALFALGLVVVGYYSGLDGASRTERLLPLTVATVPVLVSVLVAGISAIASPFNTVGLTYREGGVFVSAGGPNIAGIFVAAVLVATIAYILDEGNHHRLAAASVAVLATTALLSTLSRRAWVAAGLILILQILGRRRHRTGLSRRIGLLGTLVAAIAVAVSLLSVERFQARLDSASDALDYRTTEYARFRAGDLVDKLAGGGLDAATYWFSSPGVLPARIPVHSSYLFVLLAGGVVGLALLLYALVMVPRSLRRSDRWSDSAVLAVAGVLAVGAIAGETILLGPYSWPFWLIVGYAAGATRERTRNGTGPPQVAARVEPRGVEHLRQPGPSGLDRPRRALSAG